MSYNTGNPVPSKDPRDLVDNSESFDIRSTSRTVRETPDRLGVMRKTWYGMERDFAEFLANSGYQPIGDYAPGIEITAYNQIVRDSDGELWRLSSQIELPYVTTGAGLPEGGAFVAVGDAALRQDLASTTPGQGASLVSMESGESVEDAVNNRVIRINSRTEMKAYDVPVGTQFSLEEGGRSGLFVVKAGTPPSDPQEGIYVALDNGNYAQRIFDGPVNVFWFGAKGDGVTNDTTAIQEALKAVYTNNGGNGETVFFPAGTFVSGPITIGSNINIVLSPATILSGLSGAFPNENDAFINISSQENVVIDGSNALVTMPKSEFTTGEGRHTVSIYNSKNVKIYDLRTEDSGGDGFYIGAPTEGFCENILLSNCYANNHRRQGISVISVKGLTVDGGVYSNTKGTAPEAGIDLEPNHPSQFLQNIHIRNVFTNQNRGAGILFALMNLDSTSAPVSITVENHVSRVDGADNSSGSLRFVGPTDPVKGSILIQGGGSYNVPASPIKIDFWPVTAPRVTIKDREDVDFGTSTGNENRCCVSWFMRASDPVVNQGNFLFENITSNSTNDRAVAHTWLSQNGTTGEFHDIEIINCKSKAGSELIITDKGNLSVIQPDHYTVISEGTSAETIARNPGRIIIPSTTQTLTLPPAEDFFGRVIKARLDSSSIVLTISPATGDRIAGYSFDTSIVLRDVGDTVYLTPVDSETWAFVKSFKWNQNQFWT